MTTKSMFWLGGCSALLLLAACSSPAPSANSSSPAPTPTTTATQPVAQPELPAATTDYTTPPLYGADAGYLTPGLDGGIPGACNVTTGKPNCDTCIKGACCTQVNACDSDPQCVAVDSCTTLCAQQYVGNPQYAQACANQCYQQNPGGAQKLQTVYQCVQTTCIAQCQ